VNSVQYTLADANRWAEFSGDYNPIHFDLEQARLRGEGLRVHGMRALLDIKQEIARAALGLDESAAYLRCVARLRQPVWCDTPYQLIRAGRKASIVHSDSGIASMSCQVSAVQSLVDGDKGESGTLEAVDIIRHGQTFSALQPHTQQWQFLDALLFRYLIHDSGLLRQQVLCHYFPENAQASFEAIFTQFPVVQTHQELVFDRRLLASWEPSISPEALVIHIEPALLINDAPGSALVRIAAHTHYQHAFISNAITLKIG